LTGFDREFSTSFFIIKPVQFLGSTSWSLALTIHLNSLKNNTDLHSLSRLIKIFSKLSAGLNKIIDNCNKKSSSPEDNIYLIKVAIFDTYVNILMTFVIIYNSSKNNKDELEVFNQEAIEEINTVIKFCNSALSYQISEIKEASELRSADFRVKINSLLRLCTITWRGIDLENFAHNLSLKGICFNIILRHYEEPKKILKAASELIKQPTIYGVLSNLLIATESSESIELKSHYFYAALNIVLKNHFGKNMSYELLFLALAKYPNAGIDSIDISDAFSNLMDSGIFEKYLILVKDEELDGLVMNHSSFSKQIKNLEQRNKLKNMLFNRINLVTDHNIQSSLKAYLSSIEIIKNIYEDKVPDSKALLEVWEKQYDKNTHSHAGILNALVNRGFYASVKEDCFNVLYANFDELIYNIFLLLANSMSKYCVHESEKKYVREYIEKAINEWSRVSLKIANEAPKNAKRNKIRLVFFVYAFDRG
jgi:hypothetical protein